MKKVILPIIILVCIGCKDNAVSKKVKEVNNNVTNTSNAVKEMNKMQEDIVDLQNTEPLTNDALKAWLPEEVNGMKRISYKAGQMGVIQIGSIEATYANEDKSKKFKIELIDGAGAMGASATAGMRMMFSQEFEEENEQSSRRTAKRNGIKVIEEYKKTQNNSTIQYMQDKRFYIRGTGTNMDLDETWNALKEFDTEDLT
ncbi:MAG: hypothetical protein R2797_07215 [Gelidibacter sp.]